MINGKIWLSSPTMHGDEMKFIQEAFNTNWVAPLGPNVDEFEEFVYYKAPKKISSIDKIKIAVYTKQSQKKADEYYYSLFCKNPTLKDNDVYISVGGDNYCYGDSHISIAMNRELRTLGKKTVLWGCSVGEEDLTADKIQDLKGFDLIVTRETFTYNALIKNGVDKNTVLYPDSAFTLDIDTVWKVKLKLSRTRSALMSALL